MPITWARGGPGVGRAAAEATIRRHPGHWEIGFQNENPTAARFWRRLAAQIGSNVQERLQPVTTPHIPDDIILSFDIQKHQRG